MWQRQTVQTLLPELNVTTIKTQPRRALGAPCLLERHMLRLDLTSLPRWLDLAPGVRLQLRPLTTALMVAARHDPAVAGLSDTALDEERAVAFARALARLAVLDWQGVGDAEGAPIDPSQTSIDALLDIWPIFEAFQIGYVSKGLLLDAEKNASAPSPTGSSAGASAIAPPVAAPAPTARPE
jgi:hypothetical protein